MRLSVAFADGRIHRIPEDQLSPQNQLPSARVKESGLKGDNRFRRGLRREQRIRTLLALAGLLQTSFPFPHRRRASLAHTIEFVGGETTGGQLPFSLAPPLPR